MNRTRCSLCPRGCSLLGYTVAGRPYLMAPDGPSAPSCALRPAVHHFALMADRLRKAILRTGETSTQLDPTGGLEIASGWIVQVQAARLPVALVDLSGRPPLGLPLNALAERVPQASWLQVFPSWLDQLAGHLGLDTRTMELGLHPAWLDRAETFVPAAATPPAGHLDSVRPIADLADALRAQDRCGIVVEESGAASRLPESTLLKLAAINLQLDAVGTERLLSPRLKVESSFRQAPRSIETVADGTLELMVVDASRPMGVVPWRRLRRKLHPQRGRMIAFVLSPGPACRHADLALPAAAPLECEECVGGDRRGPATRLALSSPLHPAAEFAVDAADLAGSLDRGQRVLRGGLSLASGLFRLGRGRLLRDGLREEPLKGLSTEEIDERLREGAVWEDEPANWQPEPELRSSLLQDTRICLPAPEVRLGRLFLDGRPVMGSGETLPAIMSKVVREHPLLPAAGIARVNPDDLRRWNVRSGARCRFRTARGAVEAIVRQDASVQPRHIRLGAGAASMSEARERGRTLREAVEVLDFDPRSDAPPELLDVEVL